MLDHQATHDSITGLITGVLLPQRIGAALEHRSRRGGQVAVGFLGLDRFRRVNESLGYSAGDDLLRQVASRLAGELRVGDSLARYSADEFVIVRSTDVQDDAVALGQRMLDCLSEPFELDGTCFSVSASIGVATTVGLPEADTLLLASAAAMSVAKTRGGNCVHEFDDALRAEASRRMAVESDLHTALTKNELVLHYQPVIDLDNGRPAGVEALVRWRCADGRLVPPDDFIPVAEASGLIVELGRWVLDQACRDAAQFTGPAAGMHVSVNMSARELAQPGLAGQVRATLATSGLEPTRLFIEVTESALMVNEALAEQTLKELTRLGVHIAVDDFGTGYSSLLYLRRYPITILKVDRAFVSGIGESTDDEAICRSVVSLSQALNLTAVAEGVETRLQADALRSYGCRYAQGFLWSAAVPLADLNDTLAELRKVDLPLAG
ncbi:MAG: bifunctional diguanylate cyclase/phosphodiesterase [Actinomycetota bacterium]|nr:bifunctional diguanylate cyclase/phosphodiesterase [Actinomycetota bacterium]